MKVRSSGVLLHPTSLFTDCGIGDLGPAAYRFADMLSKSGQSIWQVLPMNPTESGHGNSPYHSISTFAGNPVLISPELLAQAGLIDSDDTGGKSAGKEGHVDFDAAAKYKERLFRKAFDRYEKRRESAPGFELFLDRTDWLEDYALFKVLRSKYPGKSWNQWPGPLRDREPDALAETKEKFASELRREEFLQYLFYSQWHRLKEYCNRRGIRIFGDVPIYMPYESVDVWVNPKQFKLDENLKPLGLSGVPPDYFSATGQLWGHPVYDWHEQRQTRFAWWTRRIEHNLGIFDIVRIDHFRGLVGFWEVAPGERTAQYGHWVDAPAEDFLNVVFKRFGSAPIVAEDLGTITPDVNETIHKFGLPGMRVLQFAFGGDFPRSTHLPHFHEKNCVVYTGSHDNNTAAGWYKSEIDEETKGNFRQYLGRSPAEDEIHWELIRLAMTSIANTAVIPMQDLIGLGPEARMNTPGEGEGNWTWRMTQDQFAPGIMERLALMTRTYGR